MSYFHLIFLKILNVNVWKHNLDPFHYYTSAGLTFDAMLELTKIELELLTDPEMLLFIESAIRSDVSECSNRYAKANNRYMESNCDPKWPESYTIYFDINNQ